MKKIDIIRRLVLDALPKDFFRSRTRSNHKPMTYKTLQADYLAKLLIIQRDINDYALSVFESYVKRNVRLDSLDEIDALMMQILDRYSRRLREIENIATTTLYNVDKRNSQKYQTDVWRQLGVQVSIDRAFVQNWVKGNVSLITNVNTKQITQIERIMRTAAFTGKTQSGLMSELSAVFKGTERNIALIVRDQINKLGGELDAHKQTQAGVEGYYWRTSRDEAVRSNHADLEGKFFRWDSPPDIGHPGEPIQCRCDAEPALDRLLLQGKELDEALKQREKQNDRFKEELKAKQK